MITFSEVYQIWLNLPPTYRLPITQRQKEESDAFLISKISSLLQDSDATLQNQLGKIIYYDQITSHLYRNLNKEERDFKMLQNRLSILHLSHHIIENQLEDLTEFDLVYTLFPLKHIHIDHFLFQTTERWMKLKGHDNFYSLPILSSFYKDTVKKYYQSNIKIEIPTYFEVPDSQIEKICEKFYPQINEYDNQIQLFDIKYPEVVVSLSGGVDSMTLLYYFKKKGIKVSAFHLQYNNREESKDEFYLIQKFCHQLDVPLFTFSIQFLKRKRVERDFYEKMTREIRFECYRQFKETPIVLGHIRDDLIENIWTNFANGRDLFNLGKMEEKEEIEGVTIYRPLLHLSKSEILNFSERYQISFTKNTTPAWSNRGKMRDTFLHQTHLQFGNAVDSNIFYLYQSLRGYKDFLDRHLFNKIFDSMEIKDNIYILKIEDYADYMPHHFWNQLFITLFNKYLNLHQPSRKCIEQLIEKIKKGSESKFMMKKNVLLHLDPVQSKIQVEKLN